MNALEKLSSARTLLAEARTVPDVKKVRDLAETAREYAKKANLGLEAQNFAAEIKLQAERKAGELLALTVSPGNPQLSHGETIGLDDLGVSRSQSHRWQRVASVPDEDFSLHVKKTLEAGKELTTSSVLKLAKQSHSPNGQLPDLPQGHYRTIVVDPPWRYDNKATRGSAEDHYKTMTLEDIEGLLPDKGWAADDSHLYLWATNNFLREAFQIAEAWGFTYRTLLTWVKPQMGMGNYFRSVTEHALFCTKGHLPTANRDVRNVVEADRTQHSSKPDAFYDLVERQSPAPYLDVFSRRRRFGWDVWGDEA